MENLIKKYFRGDTTIWLVFIILCVFSIIELYSASSTLAFKFGNHATPILQHVIFLLGGAFTAFMVHFIPYQKIRLIAYPVLILSFILLIYVQFKGQTANDAARWIRIFGFQFQPSEFAKLSVVIVVADLISRIRTLPNEENRYFYWLMGITIIIAGLILIENFSTAAILGSVVFFMMFVGKVSWKKLLLILAIVIGSLFLGYVTVKAIPQNKMPAIFDRAYTWVNRIDSKSGEDKDKYVINDKNLQVQHGRIAVARGGLFGVLPGNSIQRDFLPHAYDDFIFAIIVEEMGLFGGIFIMFLYLILLFRTGQIATVCKHSFAAMLVIGLGLIITLQATVNMIVGSGFGLVTGQPLPLISRGGTSILITSIYFGIILGVIRQIKAENEKHNYDVKTSSSNDIQIINVEEL